MLKSKVGKVTENYEGKMDMQTAVSNYSTMTEAKSVSRFDWHFVNKRTDRQTHTHTHTDRQTEVKI